MGTCRLTPCPIEAPMGWVYKPESLIIGYAPLESRTKQWATESQIEGWFPPPGGEPRSRDKLIPAVEQHSHPYSSAVKRREIRRASTIRFHFRQRRSPRSCSHRPRTEVRPTVQPDARSTASVVLYLPSEIRNLTVTETSNCGFSTLDILYQNGRFTYRCFVDMAGPVQFEDVGGVLTNYYRRVSQYRLLGVEDRDEPVFEDEFIPAWLEQDGEWVIPDVVVEYDGLPVNPVEVGLSNFEDGGGGDRCTVSGAMTQADRAVYDASRLDCGVGGGFTPEIASFGSRFAEGYVDAIIGGLSAVFSSVELAEGVDAPFPVTNAPYDYQVSVEIPDEYRNKALVVGALFSGGLRPYRSVFHSAVTVNIHDASGDVVHSYMAHGRGSQTNSGFVDAIRINLLVSAEEAMTFMSNEVAEGGSRWISDEEAR